MRKHKKILIAIPLVLVALFVSACSETKDSEPTSPSPQAVVDDFAEANYTIESGIVAFESAVLTENDQEAVVVGVVCQEVPGEKNSVASSALVSVLEKNGDQWTIVRTPDEISPEEESLPSAISSQSTQEEIDALVQEIKDDLPTDCT